MTPEQRKQIEDKLRKREFAELYSKQGVWVRGTTPNMRTVDLTKLSTEFPGLPIVCISTGIERIEQGHSIAEIDDIRSEIAGILKHRGTDEQKEQPAPVSEVKHEKEHTEAETGKVAKIEGTKTNAPEVKPEPKSHVMPAEVVKSKGDKKMETRKEEKVLAIKEPEVTLSIDVIKQYICPTATDAEAFSFLQLCHYRQLNPFLKEAYLIKYGNTTSMVVGKDAFTRKAEESPAFDGYEAGIVLFSEGKFEERVGTILKPKEELVGGWAKVYRKNTAKPFEVRVSLAEYDKKMNNWKSMPATMIRKVALVQALREAFTKELGGCYDATEIDPDAVIVEEKK